jgi:phosphoglycolate phosphatase-like HAD superfamily hydrolase
MRLYLFDIDGTLIHAHGAGRVALGRALAEVYGTAGAVDSYDTRGKTDPLIVVEVMRRAGIPEEVIHARLPQFFATYAHHLDAVIDDGHPVRVLPGVSDLLHALSQRPDALVGLLTGNTESGARAKLRPTGLLPYFRVGAYGSDDPVRRRLPAIARDRAQALTGRAFPFADIWVIGDTPLDIDCARACGAVAVAVASGQHPIEELEAHAPDLLFRDFSDVEAALVALTGSRLPARGDV